MTIKPKPSQGIQYVTVSDDDILRETMSPVRSEHIGCEADFEETVIEHISEICEGLMLPEIYVIGRQRLIKVHDFYIKPDILVRHIDGSMTIFEVKKANAKYPSTGTSNQLDAVGQLLLYGNVLSAKIKDTVRLALIDNKIYYRTVCAMAGYHLPITLIDFQKNRVMVPYFGWDNGEDWQTEKEN